MVAEALPLLNRSCLRVAVCMAPAPDETATVTALRVTEFEVYSLVNRIRKVPPPMDTWSTCRSELLGRPGAGGRYWDWDELMGSGDVAQVPTHLVWAWAESPPHSKQKTMAFGISSPVSCVIIGRHVDRIWSFAR